MIAFTFHPRHTRINKVFNNIWPIKEKDMAECFEFIRIKLHCFTFYVLLFFVKFLCFTLYFINHLIFFFFFFILNFTNL